MTKLLALITAPLLVAPLLGGCKGPAPAARATTAEQDIAMVEQAQDVQPPVQPIVPQPVSFAYVDVPGSDIHVPHDVARPRAGDGCSFFAPGQREPVLVALPELGLIKHDGEYETFASDSGSQRVSGNLPVKFFSKAHTLQLADDQSGPDTLTIADKYGRTVYASKGELRCKV